MDLLDERRQAPRCGPSVDRARGCGSRLPPEGERGLSSADLEGDVSLVNVWASWCVPCRREKPLFLRLDAPHPAELGRHEVADRHWRAIVEVEPSNAEALLGLALALQEQGRMEEALVRYRAVLAREPRRYYEVVKTLSGAARGFLLLRPSALRHLLMD